MISRGANDSDKMKDCLQEYSVTAAEVFDYFMVKGEVEDENNRNVKCVFHCITMKNGMTDEIGNINILQMKMMLTEKYSLKLDKDAVDALVDKCAVRSSEKDPCEKLYQFHKCHMKAFLSI